MTARRKLALYSFATARAGMAGGGTDIFCSGLERFLTSQSDRLDVRIVPLTPTQFPSDNVWISRGRYGLRLVRDYNAWLGMRADYHVFVYPKLPIVAFTTASWLLNATRTAWIAWSRYAQSMGETVIVVVEDLPAEQGFKRDRSTIDMGTPMSRLEQLVFRTADLAVLPSERMATYVRRKHSLPTNQIEVFRRNIYMPPDSVSGCRSIQLPVGTNVLYSGSVDQRMAPAFREALRVFARHRDAHLWVCGRGQRSVESWIRAEDLDNVHHLGVLQHATHDALAQRCDFGLLLYPRSFYNDMTPTMKYAAYAANGLAILSTDLATVRDNLEEDGIGKALPMEQLLRELDSWIERPAAYAELKRAAEALAPTFRKGTYMQEWFDEVVGITNAAHQAGDTERVLPVI